MLLPGQHNLTHPTVATGVFFFAFSSSEKSPALHAGWQERAKLRGFLGPDGCLLLRAITRAWGKALETAQRQLYGFNQFKCDVAFMP